MSFELLCQITWGYARHAKRQHTRETFFSRLSLNDQLYRLLPHFVERHCLSTEWLEIAGCQTRLSTGARNVYKRGSEC